MEFCADRKPAQPSPGSLIRPQKSQRRAAEYFHDNFYVTSSGFFTFPPLQLSMQVVGSEHLMFSIDYPFVPNVPGRELIDNLSTKLLDERARHREVRSRQCGKAIKGLEMTRRTRTALRLPAMAWAIALAIVVFVCRSRPSVHRCPLPLQRARNWLRCRSRTPRLILRR